MKNLNHITTWMQIILKERYCVDVDVTIRDESWFLSADGFAAKIKLPLCAEFFQLGKSSLSCSHWHTDSEGWNSVLGEPLPVIGVASLHQPLIQIEPELSIIHFDILGFTYWCLSRAEEVETTELDHYQRFSAKFSHAYKHGYLERPIVDEWLHILEQVIQETWEGILLKKNQFSVKVSHDVDAPSQFGFVNFRRFIRRCGRSILLDKNIKNIFIAPFVLLFTKQKILKIDAFNHFDWIMSLSEKYDITSAFYFICGCTDAYKDADYKMNYPAIRNLMREIHQRGHEIGLHPSFNTYLDAGAIKSEFSTLKLACLQEGIQQSHYGGRMHYLRWQHPYTLQAWNDAGLAYDSTMTYADHAGFRCGTCFEYPAINPVSKEILNLRIRPLVAMECSIIEQAYMGLGTGEEAKQKFLALAKKCALVGGCFTTLWHNSEFVSIQKRKLYREILCTISKATFIQKRK